QPAKTMEQILDETVAPRRFEMALSVSFAAAALLLVSMGIYGLISYSVARRTGEIGIRIALGADRARLLSMIVREGLRPVLVGLAVGIAAGLAVSRLFASQLYGIAPDDPATFGAVAGLLVLVALAACWMPARRAMRTDPIAALRFE